METPSANADLLADKQGWDDYWNKKNMGGWLYDLIAEFHRKVIIRPSLNRFIKKYFKPGKELLHAGCGSGQVDADIRHYVSITGLDISMNALRIYRKENHEICKSMHGSIFQIPAPDGSFDGIYNLGVMEHFDEKDNHKILTEFRRVLKKDGKVIIFWPPEFGLSVIFLKVLGFIFRVFLGKKNVKFHPDEICRVQSRDHATEIFWRAGFRIVEYYFGMRDIFTYSVITSEKFQKDEV